MYSTIKNIPMNTEEQRDELLWRIAKKRAAFKQACTVYFFLNAFLVGIWFFSTGPFGYFWPKWPMLGMAFGLAVQYFDAYQGNAIFSAEDEYKRMKGE
jgi:2TM domain